MNSSKDLTHVFNGDIGFAPGSAELIRQQYAVNREHEDPLEIAKATAIKEILVHDELNEQFSRFEDAAVGKKKRLHRLGSISLVITGVALMSSAIVLGGSAADKASKNEVQSTASEDEGRPVANKNEEQSAASKNKWHSLPVYFKLLDTYGPYLTAGAFILGFFYLNFISKLRRVWLDNRFAAERLRHWHFQMLLDQELTRLAVEDISRFKEERSRRFGQFLGGELQQVTGARKEWGERLDHAEKDLCHNPGPMKSDHPLRDQVWEAFKWLRLDHQARHWSLKRSPDENLSLYNKILKGTSRTCFGIAIGVLIVQLFLSGHLSAKWPQVVVVLPALELLLLAISVTAEKIDSSLGCERELEHYEVMSLVYVGIMARAKTATTNKEQYQVMRDLEIWAESELTEFLRIHQNAEFFF